MDSHIVHCIVLVVFITISAWKISQGVRIKSDLQALAFPHLFSSDPYFPVCSSISLQAKGPFVLPSDDHEHHDANDYYDEHDNDDEDANVNDGKPAAMSCSLERGFFI